MTANASLEAFHTASTTHQNLPPGFQTAEFMLEHGLIDAIVARPKLRERLGALLAFMMPV